MQVFIHNRIEIIAVQNAEWQLEVIKILLDSLRNGLFSMNRIIRLPETAEVHDWTLANWYAIADAFGPTNRFETIDEIMKLPVLGYTFRTQVDTPKSVTKELSRLFPELYLRLSYTEPVPTASLYATDYYLPDVGGYKFTKMYQGGSSVILASEKERRQLLQEPFTSPDGRREYFPNQLEAEQQ